MSDIQLIKGSDALPFSAATIHNEVVYVSGQVGFKPNTMELVSDEVGAQADQMFANIDAILEEAGTSRDRIMRVCVYLVHCQRDFATMNGCFRAWLGDHRPARSTIGVELAAPGILIEADCVAALP